MTTGRSRQAPLRHLNRDLIVDQALALARVGGVAGVSMRKVANALGVEVMSLYHWVPSRDALLVLMADRSVALIPAPDPALPWPDRLRTVLLDLYQAGLDNPVLFEVLAAEQLRPRTLISAPDAGGAVMRLLESILRMLAEAGLSGPQMVHAFRGLLGIIVGFLVAQVDGLPTARAQTTASGRLGPLGLFDAIDPAEGVSYAVDLFLAGLRHSDGQSPPAPGPEHDQSGADVPP
ncbi:DNA-binding transcriptional regulator, AcrR family [Nakamurella panacisegetis]|uniref:DNA-binding transcriptional regulator, AcrR family n=1 Tax=Nakamurella panacisegetis TaxID=1090615 RepID=A0A1H0S9L8_9ACTN|nr:TetR family transcriptional regulator [Nakamurella panacisegetis]SDP38355.1 DNA-binding transcriptional regulator, AcrR family [Nakamurella panacisegetis]